MIIERIISLDPGDVHCGYTEVFLNHFEKSVVPLLLEEKTPHWVVDSIYHNIDKSTLVVIESFSLRRDLALRQVGSEMLTSQLIGFISFYREKIGLKTVFQPPSIKKPTEGLMRATNIKHLAVSGRKGGHVKDSETHLWHYLFKNGLEDYRYDLTNT